MVTWVVDRRIARFWQGLSPRHSIVTCDLDDFGSSFALCLSVKHVVNSPGLETSIVPVFVGSEFRLVLSSHALNLVNVDNLLQCQRVLSIVKISSHDHWIVMLRLLFSSLQTKVNDLIDLGFSYCLKTFLCF